MVIQYTLARSTLVSLGIYAEDDALVHTFAWKQGGVKGQNAGIWIGDTNRDAFADIGLYIVWLVIGTVETTSDPSS